MTHKIKILIVAAVLCLTLMSVGFAGWSISQVDPSDDANGRFAPESISYSEDYIKLEGDPQMFTCTYRGFRRGENTEDSTLSYSDEIVLEYTINLGNCRVIYNSESIIAEFSIGLTDMPKKDVFHDGYVSTTISCDTENVIELSAQNADTNAYYADATVSLNNSIESVVVTVTYRFDLKDQDTYFDYIYSEFFNGKEPNKGQSFSFNAIILERA